MANVPVNTASGPAVAADSGTRDATTEYIQLVRVDNGLLPTYFASSVGLAGVAGIFFLLTGNATTTVKLRRVLVSGVAGTGAFFDLQLNKYTSAASGGTTGTAPTIGKMDSNSGAASATVAIYTAAPTAGTLNGIVAARKILLSASGTLTYIAPQVEFNFHGSGEHCPVLRGTAQQLGLTLSAAPATGSIDVTFVWTEETNSF